MSTNRIFTRAYITLGVLLVSSTGASAQETENPQVVVRAEAGEIPSAYGAPPDLSHGRISTLTKSYVLSPFSSKVDSKATPSATAYRFSFSGKKSKWGCLHASLSEYKTKSNISPEILSTGVSLLKRVTHWLIGTSSPSIPQFQLNTVSPL